LKFGGFHVFIIPNNLLTQRKHKPLAMGISLLNSKSTITPMNVLKLYGESMGSKYQNNKIIFHGQGSNVAP
jgi:hypothetical protein